MRQLFALGVLLVSTSAFRSEDCGPLGRCRDEFYEMELVRELQHMSIKTSPPAPSPTNDAEIVSRAPVTAPTPVPAPSVPVAPPEKCTSIDGFFGDVSGQQSIYRFVYELETVPEEGVSIEYDILPPLEVAFNNYLLPALFPDICGEAVRRRLVSGISLRIERRRLKVQGISARPDDSIVKGKTCSSIETAGDDCNVVNGQLTLFMDSATARLLNEDDLISQTLNEGMANGSFLSASPSVRRVTFVEGGMDDNPDQGTGGDKGAGNTESSSGNGLMVGFVVAGAGALMVITGIVACRRRNGEGTEDMDQTATFMQDNPAPVLVEGTGAASRKPIFIDEVSVDASIYNDKSLEVSDTQSELPSLDPSSETEGSDDGVAGQQM